MNYLRKLLIIIPCILTMIPAYGDLCPWDDLEFGADFIYWKPCLNDLDYAISYSGDPEIGGKYQYLDHCYSPGFRVFGRLDDLWCGLGISGSYTYLWDKEENKVLLPAGGDLLSTLARSEFNIGTSSEIRASHSLRYQTFDALFFYSFNCCGPCSLLIPFLGVEGMKLEQDTISNAVSENNPNEFVKIHWDSEYLGLGLKLGTEYRILLPCHFHWFFKGSFTVLGGVNNSYNTLIHDEGTEVKFTFKDCENLCLPGCHLAAGLRYELSLCGRTIKFQLGYEFLDWWNIPKIRRASVSDEDLFIEPATLSTGSNLTLHGLFAGLDFGF